jgi:hypothetical protein
MTERMGWMRAALGGVGLAVLLAGCAATLPAPVAVQGADADLQALAGEWAGEYWGGSEGRSGSIVFRLDAVTGAAVGDVVMVPTGAGPLRPHTGVAEGAPSGAEALGIRFVRADGGLVRGVLEPYRDPDCGCALTTTFQGRLGDGVVEGTFVTRGSGTHPESTGGWRVRRVRG